MGNIKKHRKCQSAALSTFIIPLTATVVVELPVTIDSVFHKANRYQFKHVNRGSSFSTYLLTVATLRVDVSILLNRISYREGKTELQFALVDRLVISM